MWLPILQICLEGARTYEKEDCYWADRRAGGHAFLANLWIKSAGDAILELKLPLQYFQSHILSKGWWENNAVYEYVYSEAMLEYIPHWVTHTSFMPKGHESGLVAVEVYYLLSLIDLH